MKRNNHSIVAWCIDHKEIDSYLVDYEKHSIKVWCNDHRYYIEFPLKKNDIVRLQSDNEFTKIMAYLSTINKSINYEEVYD